MEVLIEAPNVNEAVLVGCHEQGPLAAHVVHRHGNVSLTHLLEGLATLLPSPELDSAVPSAANDD